MKRNILRETLKKPRSRKIIFTELCHEKSVLDLGCVQHSAEHESSQLWLHGIIKKTAKNLVGVDYAQDEIIKLREKGYNILFSDINKEIPTNEKFDVIVVGNLIEHLSCFDGLFDNAKRLLKNNGILAISTANPFFREQYFFSAFKNDIIVNKEHTCWIDPITLEQLANRFGFTTSKVYWVKEKWKLSQTIFHGDDQELDNFDNRWSFHKKRSPAEGLIGPILEFLFRLLKSRSEYERLKEKHSATFDRLLYMRVKGLFIDFFWQIYRLFIPTSDINRHELFVSILIQMPSERQNAHD